MIQERGRTKPQGVEGPSFLVTAEARTLGTDRILPRVFTEVTFFRGNDSAGRRRRDITRQTERPRPDVRKRRSGPERPWLWLCATAQRAGWIR